MIEAQVKTAAVAMIFCLAAAAIGMVIGEKVVWVVLGLATGLTLGWRIKLKFGGFLGLCAAALVLASILDQERVGAVATGLFAVLSAAFLLFARMQYANFQKPSR